MFTKRMGTGIVFQRLKISSLISIFDRHIFSSSGRRPASVCHGPSCVRASVRVLTFSLNIFFSETIYRILMKFHRKVPGMVLFRIS